jgi:hypothetical protein
MLFRMKTFHKKTCRQSKKLTTTFGRGPGVQHRLQRHRWLQGADSADRTRALTFPLLSFFQEASCLVLVVWLVDVVWCGVGHCAGGGSPERLRRSIEPPQPGGKATSKFACRTSASIQISAK